MKKKRLVWCLSLFILSVNVILGQLSAEKLKLAGLKDEVIIRKDYRGIPYIQAKNDDDLYFAQGFVTASDRLWQMDLYRRLASGRTAEIFGSRTLEEDKRWRRLGFKQISEAGFPQLSKDLQQAMESYSRGVNAYIDSLNPQTLPPEFKILQYMPDPWKPADTILIGKILADGLSSTWRNDLLRAALQKSLSPEKFVESTNIVTPYDLILFDTDNGKKNIFQSFTKRSIDVLENDLKMAEKEADTREKSLRLIGFYAEELAASNNWVISGKKTADGKPILANDPHLQPSTPNIWYLVHLSAPGWQASGVTLAGTPGVILGHNDSIAWGATNVGPDVQDLYLEKFNSAGEYQTPNGWTNPIVRKEELKVRKNPLSTETETAVFDVMETRNGVIYTEEGGQKFALKWTARDPKNQEFEVFYLLNRAKSWTDFQNAIKTYGGATQNFVYADTKGNIGWIAGGKIPLRKTGDGSFPYDGTTDEGEWIGYIPFTELPRLYNPASGFIVTANQRIVGTNYKYQQMGRDVAAPWRARRIFNLINENNKINLDDVTAMQRDIYSLPHKMLADELIKLGAASPETLSVLRNWDGKMSADSRGALLINTLRNVIAEKIAAENKPLPAFAVRERLLHFILSEKPAHWLPKEFASYPEFFKASDQTARENLQKQWGNDESKWIWGNTFKANFPHPLAGVPLIGAQFATPTVGIDGSGVTPNVGSNVSMRLIAVPDNWDITRQVIPLGQSGNPNSPHYKDQFASWNKGDLPIFPFSQKAVESAAKETWILQPK